MLERLLHRIVDTNGIDAGDTGLHLTLAVVNAGFEVEELPRQQHPRESPVKPEVIAGERHHHRPHPKRQPAGGGH